MDLKVKAALIVFGYVVASVLGIAIVQLAFTHVPTQILGMFGLIVVGGFFLSLAYSIVLAQLKYKKTLTEMTKK